MLFVAIPFLVAGCATPSKPDVVDKLDSWFEIQEKIAGKLQNEIGGKRKHISPILGAQYSIGSVLSSDNDFVTKCTIEKNKIEKFNMRLPMINAKINFDANMGLPESWISQYKIGQAQANYKFSGETKYKLTNIIVSTISSLNINDLIKNNKCFDALRDSEYVGKEIKVVRGVISGKLVASSNDMLDIGANLSVSETELLKIKFDPNGGFSVEEKNSSPQYFIYTKVSIPSAKNINPPKNSDPLHSIDESGCQYVAGFAYSEEDEEITDVSLMVSKKEKYIQKCNKFKLDTLGK